MRLMLKVSAVVVGLVALIGALHMPFARSMLARVGGCPFPTSGRTLGPAAAEALRLSTLQQTRGNELITTRDAAGFLLAQDTRADVKRWASTHGVTCREDRHGAGVRCDDVAGPMLRSPRAADETLRVLLAFDLQDRLVGVQLQSVAKSSSEARARVAQAERMIASAGGDGLSDVARLERPLGQSKAQLRAANYSAELVITHMGREFAIYESYQAL